MAEENDLLSAEDLLTSVEYQQSYDEDLCSCGEDVHENDSSTPGAEDTTRFD